MISIVTLRGITLVVGQEGKGKLVVGGWMLSVKSNEKTSNFIMNCVNDEHHCMRSAGLDAEQLLLLLGLVAVPLVLQHLVRAPDRHEQIPGHRAQRVRHTRVRTQPEDRLQPIICQY